MTMQMPVLYIPHGGGPLPLMNEPSHRSLTQYLKNLHNDIPQPEAILVVSAHWETAQPSVLALEEPELLFDYYNFPPETYQYNYPVPGAIEKAKDLTGHIQETLGVCSAVEDRGYDHGVFVPLMLMYPQADVPVFQLSLNSSLDAKYHLELGEQLAYLRQQGVLILGSGYSFHNLSAMFNGGDVDAVDTALKFDQWLNDNLTGEVAPEQIYQSLVDWTSAPGARFCHPREEHLLPLHVCAAAAGYQPAESHFRDEMFGFMISGFLWSK